MVANTKRGIARSYLDTPIMYSTGYDEFFPAKTQNKSFAGMSFKAGHYIAPGTKIRIKILNDSPDLMHNPEAYKVVKAEVKWCGEIKESATKLQYEIGVKY